MIDNADRKSRIHGICGKCESVSWPWFVMIVHRRLVFLSKNIIFFLKYYNFNLEQAEWRVVNTS